MDSFRRLTIIHPLNQVDVAAFYECYKELIIYFCNKSSISIGKPHHIAKHLYYRDKLHRKNLSEEELGIEQHNKEYENLKSYFSYDKYSNIHKFYDDYLFNRCEKKYNYMVKLDVSKCFDSIYTHSISWATHGKEYIKNNLYCCYGSFPGKFDKLMQSLNHNETNGIVIGPEFSRIFAEIIMQKIDIDLIRSLSLENLHQKIDFEIYRYVDDYFVFYNKEKDKEKIIWELRQLLFKYKLSLNDSKIILYEKPIITNISRAKSKIKRLLSEALEYSIIIKNIGIGGENESKIGKISINSQVLIPEFKSIIRESDVEYKDVLNYTLAIIERKFDLLPENWTDLR